MFIESKVYFNLGPQVPTWADGTDEEIAAALEAHYNDEIDLTEYWTVGDERVVHLSAIEATSGYSAQPAQDVTLVLVNSGGRTLTTPINNHTECAFVVGQKDCLAMKWPFTASNFERGWGSSNIKHMLNYLNGQGYLGALPVTLRGVFKNHVIPWCYDQTKTYPQNDNSIIGLPARKEILGYDTSEDKASSSYNQLTYYQDSSNRIKKISSVAYGYWTNSKFYYSGSNASWKKEMYIINTNGNESYYFSYDELGVAPQMVI